MSRHCTGMWSAKSRKEQSGSKLRLRGKGMVSMKDANVHGDHYATIEIAVPRSLNRTARQKLMEYKEAC